eukprot:CAMPEP_0169109568 /NCGR_PEP_ID=MMETSP1015-20121227/26034_1 /TAXON_ID=342587 /ORGANISM="Karlodinium micrum, Strain CCMP2283" /LENGTH=206 /DNA_ID=CAMNT_0009171273 /DNA_START=74 /DNA_END=694 /DNA_ORIENTATION=+
MRAAAIITLACLAHIGQSRRVQPEAEEISRRDLATLLFALNGPVTQSSVRSYTQVPTRARLAAMVEEPDDTAKTIGAAAAGGLLGVFFQQDIVAVGLLALAAAYASTLSNDVGDVTKKVGGFAAKSYSKVKEINEEYDILAKAKGATDSVVTVVDNINKNYGITDKIDEKLMLTDKVGKVTDKISQTVSTITDKAEELKSKATSSK